MKSKVYISNTNHSNNDKVVEERVIQAVETMGGLPKELENAKKILLKPNLAGQDTRKHNDRFIAVADSCFTSAILKLIREVNDNEIITVDGGAVKKGQTPWDRLLYVAKETGHYQLFKKYNVKLIEASDPPYLKIPVPGGGQIMRHYYLNENLKNVDATVSIQKMKVHLMMGTSGVLKNLFGLPPPKLYGWAARSYLHYLVRLPRSIVDMALMFTPCLSIIDGLVGEETQEWKGPPVESNVFLIGNNAVATDSVATALMGFDPQKDFPEKPFYFDINHLNLANKVGLGPNNLEKIKIIGDPMNKVEKKYDIRLARNVLPKYHLEAKNKLIEEVKWYLKNRSMIIEKYEGKYVAVLDKKILWSVEKMPEIRKKMSMLFTVREKMEGSYSVPFIKKVWSVKEDPEIYSAYLDN